MSRSRVLILVTGIIRRYCLSSIFRSVGHIRFLGSQIERQRWTVKISLWRGDKWDEEIEVGFFLSSTALNLIAFLWNNSTNFSYLWCIFGIIQFFSSIAQPCPTHCNRGFAIGGHRGQGVYSCMYGCRNFLTAKTGVSCLNGRNAGSCWLTKNLPSATLLDPARSTSSSHLMQAFIWMWSPGKWMEV